MFAVIYTFEVIEEKKTDFVRGWSGLTKLIYAHENSLGSRLHHHADSTYIAYAQWPDKKTFENAGKNLPESATEFRTLMRESCSSIKTSFELNVVEDLLKERPFKRE